MKKNGVGSLLVKDDDQIVGIVTATDVVHKVVAEGLSLQITNVGAVMSFPLITVEADSDVRDAGDRMAENGIRHLAVTQDGQVTGLISMRDLFRVLRTEIERKPGS